jgi:hypothetical protein
MDKTALQQQLLSVKNRTLKVPGKKLRILPLRLDIGFRLHHQTAKA